MPIYVYRYETNEGVKRLEKIYRMDEYPQAILIEENGQAYTAELEIQAHARMKTNWAVQGTDSSLPDENSPAR